MQQEAVSGFPLYYSLLLPLLIYLIPVNAPLKSFEIASTDKVFHPAKAVFDTKTKAVIVWSDEVEKPVAARYAFKNYAEASLFSTSGIPVSSFRTDNW